VHFFFPYNNLSSIQDLECSGARIAIPGYCTKQRPHGVIILKKKRPKGKAMEIIHIRRFMSISVFPTTLQLLAHFGKGEGLTSQKHKVKFSYDVCLDITRQGTIKQKNPFGLGTKYPPQRIVCLSFKLRNGLSQLSLSTSQCSVHTITKPEPFSHGVSKLRRCDDVCRG